VNESWNVYTSYIHVWIYVPWLERQVNVSRNTYIVYPYMNESWNVLIVYIFTWPMHMSHVTYIQTCISWPLHFPICTFSHTYLQAGWHIYTETKSVLMYTYIHRDNIYIYIYLYRPVPTLVLKLLLLKPSCTNAYMFASMCVCMYADAYWHMYMCMHAYTDHSCMHAHMYAYKCVCTYADTYLYMYIYVCMYLL